MKKEKLSKRKEIGKRRFLEKKRRKKKIDYHGCLKTIYTENQIKWHYLMIKTQIKLPPGYLQTKTKNSI